MPLITQNTSLGSAFGGKIASLNYNYQPNSSPSTATITVVSENNRFIEPQLLSDFVIPKLNAKTKVTQVQYNDDGNSKVLQVELQDRLSFILDKNLILVRGIHSSGVEGDKISGKWKFYESSGVPNSSNPQPIKTGVQKNKNIAIIGSLRTTLTFDAAEDVKGIPEKIESPQKAHYINSKLFYKDDIKFYEEKLKEEQYTQEQTWGYSFSELLAAINSFGLKVKTSQGFSFFSPFVNRIVLSDAGTIRSVLSSALSKFGKSFYIDPIDESIVITDNAFIKVMNTNIESIYKGNINNLGATSLNVKKSCTEVTGRHFVVKSTDQQSTKQGESAENSIRPRRPSASRFRKVFYDKSQVEIIDKREKEFLKRIAYLYGTELDDYLINLYVFSLGKKYDPTTWSNKKDKAFYGGKKEDGSTFLDKTKFIQVKKGEEEKDLWHDLLLQNPPTNFDIKKIFGAFPNTRTALITENNIETLQKDVLAAASPDSLRSYVEDFLFIAKGVFISTPIQSVRRALGWDFTDTRGLKIIGPFRSDEKVKTISELAPIQRLFDRVGGNQNITIDNLRLAAGQSKGLGKNAYYYLGIVDGKGIPVSPRFNQSYDIGGLLDKNLYLFNLEQKNVGTRPPQQYLVYTKNGEKIINDIEKVCLDAWNYTFESNLDNVVIRYIYRPIAERRGNDNSQSQDPDPGSEEVPTWHSISHDFSNIKFSSKVELDFYEGPIGDAETVLRNINTVSKEQEGPYYEANVSYFRPPQISDLNVKNGFSSLSCSFAGDNGVTTNISYSTNKYQNVDESVITQIGSSNINKSSIDSTPAFAKNTGKVTKK
jgi:hypothetical protein